MGWLGNIFGSRKRREQRAEVLARLTDLYEGGGAERAWEPIVEALRAGAYWYLEKPFEHHSAESGVRGRRRCRRKWEHAGQLARQLGIALRLRALSRWEHAGKLARQHGVALRLRALSSSTLLLFALKALSQRCVVVHGGRRQGPPDDTCRE